MMENLISVIIPVYNRENTIKNCLNSVLEQSYKNIEVIVVDDGSTDNTGQIIKELTDKRIKYIWQENKGACVARNNGISLAKGNYVAFQDSDDIWEYNKLKKQLDVLLESRADIVFCKLIGKHIRYPEPKHIRQGFVEYQQADLSGIGTQTLFGYTEIFKKYQFDERLPRLQELELLIRLCDKYKIYCIDEGLVTWNLQSNSISNNIGRLYDAGVIILEKDINILNNSPKTLGTIKGYIGTAEAYSGINDPKIFKEAYQLKKRKLDLIKYIFAKLQILSKYYKFREKFLL